MMPTKIYAVPRVFLDLAAQALQTCPALTSAKDRRTVATG
jgi:hypothetical protein